MDSSREVAFVDGADCLARRGYMPASKAPATFGSSFPFVDRVVIGFQVGFTCDVRPANRPGRGIPLKCSNWLLVPLSLLLSVLIAAMPLFSAQRARASNVFSQCIIIPTSLASSLFPIDEAPLSKFA